MTWLRRSGSGMSPRLRRAGAALGIAAAASVFAMSAAGAHGDSETDGSTRRSPPADGATPMVLRPATVDRTRGEPAPANVDPALAVLAGLLVARTSADIWFRSRVPDNH